MKNQAHYDLAKLIWGTSRAALKRSRQRYTALGTRIQRIHEKNS